MFKGAIVLPWIPIIRIHVNMSICVLKEWTELSISSQVSGTCVLCGSHFQTRQQLRNNVTVSSPDSPK